MKELFIDGTKIETSANCYTFVWRGSINYHLVGLLDTIDALYTEYNMLLSENGYDRKYELAEARMFVIERMDKNVIKLRVDGILNDLSKMEFSYQCLTDKEKAELFDFQLHDNGYNLKLYFAVVKAVG